MMCKHAWEEIEPGQFQCFECGRPQNAIHAAQEWMNAYDKRETTLDVLRLGGDARDIMEWLLEDFEKK